ncbi:ubiquinone biosynthesis accessory factor UbiJ [Candidatus Pseudomonas adelgestsugas]|uniref:Ubiquinone biosynthesis accessory factor UbiJ n=1 Tax=Candidatus Pseudomonas adelgestsugas TaxID=1302376 RepID=A0ABX5R7T3_9PSED|nr:SCP2 sterol-binding domain-containing protein [Candidatus Pseudomonas adelgestsugas]QAX81544.1 SCP-2 sterol transfer family protein [Candidatus Pseudomonas adelgestsugas]
MLFVDCLTMVEYGLNRILSLDSTVWTRLAHLNGKIIAVNCISPTLRLFILLVDKGLLLSSDWTTKADCTMHAPASSWLHLALSHNKTAVLHSSEVKIEGDSSVLLNLVTVLQDLELDWEYELSHWIGPIATQLVNWHLRSCSIWCKQLFTGINQNITEYLSEESRTIVGQREAQARFGELDKAKIKLEYLEARFKRLNHF